MVQTFYNAMLPMTAFVNGQDLPTRHFEFSRKRGEWVINGKDCQFPM